MTAIDHNLDHSESQKSKQWAQRARALRNIPPVLKIVWQSGPLVVSSNLALRLLASTVPIAMLAVSKMIVDGVVQVSKGQPLPHLFWYWVAAEFGLALLGGITGRTVGFLDSLVADRFSRHLSVRIMEKAARLDLLSYEDPVFYDKLERARVQATDRIGMVHATGTLLQQVVMAAGFCATILWFSPWLLLLLIVCIVPAFLGESHFAFLGYSLSLRQTPVRRQLDYLRVLGASRESAKELKLFNLADHFTGEFQKLSDDIYEQNLTLARRRLFAGAMLSLLTTCGYYGAYAFVVWRAATGTITPGSMTFLAGAIAGASANIQSIFSTFASIADQALFLTDLLDFFAVQPCIASKPGALTAPRAIQDGFRLEHVSFAYPGNPRRIIDGLDLHLAAGERVALVGENGQGKTTLVKLLTRLYDPTEGRILLDGVDLRDYDLESLHAQIGVIFQDFVRYEMTARENIAVGQIDMTGASAEERIHQAARKSLAADVIRRLPRGLGQQLGRRFEGGVDLSGGEWQKVALARAYLREAQFLILDEPAAALDARSEYDLFQRFASLTQGKTALLISHRFSTVRMADRILVLEGGRVVEEGCHERLLAEGGRYSAMFELQAASYR
ncbi:ABC transporter ATP-binding protein [uncultured Paludibaculum sp.]|uniref:ABC transporter ATP-binding protein n=1 Tax=uncultured Paludibaculum sp. TaxID=1765020 RepID=UPI002AAB6B7C|nr:ABC transporter ATP-binding protein [uncultured Paludibaculum sp.]